mmetsp:Transcript_18387/g.24915  ORF Transcript_18387/g.24915 Transcript_18387/m.24915 type:complete len:105 (-) Transcript_18387:3111-3425(-)
MIIIRGEAGGCVWTDATGGIVATLVMRMRKNWSPGSCFSAVLHVHRNRSKGQGIFSRQDNWAISEMNGDIHGFVVFHYPRCCSCLLGSGGGFIVGPPTTSGTSM